LHFASFECRHVSVRYKPELPDVLCDVTFTVQAGEKVGIVGRTGAGKSSLVAALFRLVQPYRGQVLIDGADALSMKLSGLRSKIGIIPQVVFFFFGRGGRYEGCCETGEFSLIFHMGACRLLHYSPREEVTAS
ncbi:P-loop containing nucleoside triphosphate hydrolase protein, partial [Pavlovales sp. CCMP2436]